MYVCSGKAAELRAVRRGKLRANGVICFLIFGKECAALR